MVIFAYSFGYDCTTTPMLWANYTQLCFSADSVCVAGKNGVFSFLRSL